MGGPSGMRWFIENASAHLIPRAGQYRPRLNYLEIGVGRGAGAEWVLEHVLTTAQDRYIGIDPWDTAQFVHYRRLRRGETPEFITRTNEETARKLLAKYGAKAVVIRGRSPDVLRDARWSHLFSPGSIQVAYIDGDHGEEPVFMDSEAAWPLLQVGGVALWDDYRVPYGRECRKGIDRFLESIKGRYKVLFVNKQLGVEKLA